MTDGQQAAQSLAVLRIGAGVGAWLMPNLAARIMGMQPGGSLAFILRLFGVREIIMGVGYLAASPDDRDNWLRMGIVADAADAVAAAAAVRRRAVPARTGVPMTLTALGAVAAGAASGQNRR